MTSFIFTICACGAYSILFSYLLGVRILRTKYEAGQPAFFLISLVIASIVAATTTAEGLILMQIDRDAAGRILYAATMAGVFVFALGTAGVITAKPQNPLSAAIAHKRLLLFGLTAGNFCVLAINFASFTTKIPSML